jgi:hypothetical protein
MIKKIEEQLKTGAFTKANTRYSPCIGVTDWSFNNGKTIPCKVIQDDIYDYNGKLIYSVERHIGISSDYYTTDIYSHQKGHYL